MQRRERDTEFDQLILIDKPTGISSFGVVAKVRGKLTEINWQELRKIQPSASRKSARVKVGHCGTLDPFATGLLLLVSGTYTRRAGEFSKLDKTYTAKIRLGAVSTTGDPEGDIREKTVRKKPLLSDVEKVIQAKFQGTISQIPPIFSAIKINGHRAYDLARKGEAPNMPARNVTIYSLEILDYQWPNLSIRAHVSSGTYIRTLAEDIGSSLGVGAYCAELRREKIGTFDVQDAKTVTEFLATA
jgi:tRNA pseudouridine55 synthase